MKSLLNDCFIKKIQQNFCGTNKIHSFTQSWNWISIYSKIKFIILNKNTHNFFAKPDKNWLKSGFYMKLTEIWLLEVPLSIQYKKLAKANAFLSLPSHHKQTYCSIQSVEFILALLILKTLIDLMCFGNNLEP